jgi:hypothetical protein
MATVRFLTAFPQKPPKDLLNRKKGLDLDIKKDLLKIDKPVKGECWGRATRKVEFRSQCGDACSLYSVH